MPRPAWPSTADEALLAVALLARDADGVVRPEELQLIADRLSHGLRRMGPQAQREAGERLSALLAKRGLEGALRQVRQALPEPSARLAAVALAFRVAWSDQELHPLESEHLAFVARTLDVEDAKLRALLSLPA